MKWLPVAGGGRIMRWLNPKLVFGTIGGVILALTTSAAEPARRPPASRLTPAQGRTQGEPGKDVWAEGVPKSALRASRPGTIVDEVNWGIAAQYPDDVGLERDRSVIFKVDFDNGKVPARLNGVSYDDWCGEPWTSRTKTSTHAPVSGRYCAANTWDAMETGGGATRWRLGTLRELQRKHERPALFMRLYHKLDAAWYGDGKILGLKGFGFVVQAVKHGPSLPCDGKNWFSSEMQWVGWGPSAKPGIYKNLCIHGHYYAYTPYPDGIMPMLGEDLRPSSYRFSAYAKPPTWVHLDEWYCYEVALYLNTPGQADGEARFWENGRLTSHIKNMRYADTLDAFRAYATINNVRTQHDNVRAPVTRYIDNVVVASRYIGPIRFSDKQLAHFVDQGIVVHTDDARLTERMRRARDAQPKTTKPAAKR